MDLVEERRRAQDRKQDRNRLINCIPEAEWEFFAPHLTELSFRAGEVLQERPKPVSGVLFPQVGVVSLLIDMEDGFQADAGLVDSEGMVGISLLSGITKDVVAVVAQTDGHGLRMGATAFMRAVQAAPVMRTALWRYAEALRTQAMQLAACNGHHGLEPRLARCLLTLHDRHGGNEVPITHEQLASLLSAHRPSVSVAANRLRKAGLIRYAAGKVVVSDRRGLESATCECYHLIREHTEGLIGPA